MYKAEFYQSKGKNSNFCFYWHPSTHPHTTTFPPSQPSNISCTMIHHFHSHSIHTHSYHTSTHPPHVIHPYEVIIIHEVHSPLQHKFALLRIHCLEEPVKTPKRKDKTLGSIIIVLLSIAWMETTVTGVKLASLYTKCYRKLGMLLYSSLYSLPIILLITSIHCHINYVVKKLTQM